MKSLIKIMSVAEICTLILTACCDTPVCVPVPKPDCICTLQYDPVCGCDGVTYGNACAANCNSIYLYTPGECD